MLALGVLGGACCSDRFCFVWPAKGVAAAERLIRRQLLRREQVAFLMTFDEPGAREWVSRTNGINTGVEAVPGRFGWARRFNGTRWCGIQTPVAWSAVASNFTLSIWIKLEPPSDTQDILYTAAWGRRAGLRLEAGQLRFYVPKSSVDQSIAYPFARWNEWVHLAAVADAAAGRARLYENGRLLAEGPIAGVDMPMHNLQFGGHRWYSTRAPLRASVDETIVWNRALDAGEIARMARARRGALPRLAPTGFPLWQLASAWAGGTRRALRYFDFFDPRLYRPAAGVADLPELKLVLSKRDRRHFNRSHSLSQRSGRRVREGADFRHVELVANGRAMDGELALDGSDVAYAPSPRRAFLLETAEPAWDGLRQIRLAPPESVGYAAPLLDARVAAALGLPATRNGLCKVRVNGVFQGVYYYEDDARRGVDPNAAATFVRAPTDVGDWASAFAKPFQGAPAPRGPPRTGIPLSAEQLQALFDGLAADSLVPLLGKDVKAPFSRRELAYRLRELRRDLTAQWKPASGSSRAVAMAEYLTPSMVLGNNPAPFYVREDFDLDVFPAAGVSVSWSSSDPKTIDPSGRVRLPDGDRPVGAALTARFDDGTTNAEKKLEFRVMPRQPRLPAFMIYVNERLQKSRRVDCRVERYGADPFAPACFRAFQGQEGGVKFRGNTSFWQTFQRPKGEDPALRKLSLSLRFEEPHRLLDDTATKHLYLGNGYIDYALLRNKLAYDLYRAISTPDAPRYAPHVEWAEVFVNGRYEGLYECGTRIDRHLLGWEAGEPGQGKGPFLYKFVGAGDNFSDPNPDGAAQKIPERGDGVMLGPYLQLAELVRTAPAESFAAEVERQVDLAAVRDWQLLLNLTQNAEGVNANLYLAGHPAAGQRLFLIPWDYDKTFPPDGRMWLSNALTSRLRRDYPDYRKRLFDRWTELRAGPWSEASIRDRIAQSERRLAGYIEWDLRQWNTRYARGGTLAESADAIRQSVRDRLAFLDDFLAGKAMPAPEESGGHNEEDGR